MLRVLMLMTIMAFYVHLYPHVSHYWVSAPAISVIINNKGHQNSFVICQRSLLYHQRYHWSLQFSHYWCFNWQKTTIKGLRSINKLCVSLYRKTLKSFSHFIQVYFVANVLIIWGVAIIRNYKINFPKKEFFLK